MPFGRINEFYLLRPPSQTTSVPPAAPQEFLFRGGPRQTTFWERRTSRVPGVTGAAAEPAITSNYRKSDYQQRNPLGSRPGHSLQGTSYSKATPSGSFNVLLEG